MTVTPSNLYRLSKFFHTARSTLNVQQNQRNISRHTLIMLLHYRVKLRVEIGWKPKGSAATN